MISYLKGKVIAQGPDYIITETGGVGYKVYIAESRLSSYPVGKETELYCHLHMKREETLELYGVESPQALEVFETLNNISGIGPKAALNIASLGTMEQLRGAVEKGDASYFAKVHGIGQKRIQKIILELTGKLKSLDQQKNGRPEEKEAVDALVALGFSRKKAKEALSEISSEISPVEERVKQALRHIRISP
ncbi:Holliday junction branch migration protein RuvA [Patescibacteria group bacterium]|nr:Holliday junction branch migration protein RuvA [Patescibacteria group bacterium]